MQETFPIQRASTVNSIAGMSSGKTRKESMEFHLFPLPFITLYLKCLQCTLISTLLVVLCTLPVTSCSAERSFSGLKHVKTSLRSTMGNNRLSSLSMLYIHRDIDISLPEVIEEFARRYPRRLQLANIFS